MNKCEIHDLPEVDSCQRCGKSICKTCIETTENIYYCASCIEIKTNEEQFGTKNYIEPLKMRQSTYPFFLGMLFLIVGFLTDHEKAVYIIGTGLILVLYSMGIILLAKRRERDKK